MEMPLARTGVVPRDLGPLHTVNHSPCGRTRGGRMNTVLHSALPPILVDLKLLGWCGIHRHGLRLKVALGRQTQLTITKVGLPHISLFVCRFLSLFLWLFICLFLYFFVCFFDCFFVSLCFCFFFFSFFLSLARSFVHFIFFSFVPFFFLSFFSFFLGFLQSTRPSICRFFNII